MAQHHPTHVSSPPSSPHPFPSTASSTDGRPVPVGWTTVSTLKKRLQDYENASIITGATVTKLIAETSKWQGEPGVRGVEYELDLSAVGFDRDADHVEEKVKESKTILADAVVLATGE